MTGRLIWKAYLSNVSKRSRTPKKGELSKTELAREGEEIGGLGVIFIDVERAVWKARANVVNEEINQTGRIF